MPDEAEDASLTPLRRGAEPKGDLAPRGELREDDLRGHIPEDDSTGECCSCCEGCCCTSCGCESCCKRCRAWCRFSCCRRCCTCRCRGQAEEPPSPPIDISLSYGLRHAANDNILLGCFLQFRPLPTCAERWLLLLLFLTTAVFVQYSEEAMGPICVREYLAQCPPFTAVAKHGVPMTYITQGPPDVKVPEGTTIRNRRLREFEELVAARSLEADVGTDVGTVALTSNDQSKAEQIRQSALTRLSLMFGSWKFSCGKPMCDIFYPQMIDWFSLWRLTNKIWGTTSSHSIPFTSEAVIVGYCKCEGPLYDDRIRAKVSGEVRSVVITLVVQTLLPKIFRTIFGCTSLPRDAGSASSAASAGGAASGSCCLSKRTRTYVHRAAVASLLATVAAMAASVYLLKFDPQGWRNALWTSALSAALLDPLMTLLQLAFCVRAGWPLRHCGCAAPVDELLTQPWLYRQCLKKCRGDVFTGFGHGLEPAPSRMGRADG